MDDLDVFAGWKIFECALEPALPDVAPRTNQVGPDVNTHSSKRVYGVPNSAPPRRESPIALTRDRVFCEAMTPCFRVVLLTTVLLACGRPALCQTSSSGVTGVTGTTTQDEPAVPPRVEISVDVTPTN